MFLKNVSYEAGRDCLSAVQTGERGESDLEDHEMCRLRKNTYLGKVTNLLRNWFSGKVTAGDRSAQRRVRWKM